MADAAQELRLRGEHITLAQAVKAAGLADPAAAQAAQTTAVYLGWFLSSYTSLVAVGSTALIARMTGAGDRPGARRVLHQSLLLALALGLAGTALGLLALEPALALLRLR